MSADPVIHPDKILLDRQDLARHEEHELHLRQAKAHAQALADELAYLFEMIDAGKACALRYPDGRTIAIRRAAQQPDTTEAMP